MKALNRHHKRRTENKRKSYSVVSHLQGYERGVKKHLKTPKSCSCFLCGNRRKWEGETLQEKKQLGE